MLTIFWAIWSRHWRVWGAEGASCGLSRREGLAFGGAVALLEQDFDFALGGFEVLSAFLGEA